MEIVEKLKEFVRVQPSYDGGTAVDPLHAVRRASVAAALIAYVAELAELVQTPDVQAAGLDDVTRLLALLAEVDGVGTAATPAAPTPDLEDAPAPDTAVAGPLTPAPVPDQEPAVRPEDGLSADRPVATTGSAASPASRSGRTAARLRDVARSLWGQAEKDGISDTDMPEVDDRDLWTELHVLLLRRAPDQAGTFRDAAARAVGQTAERRADLLVPEWDGSPAVDLAATPPHEVITRADDLVWGAATGEVWNADQDLLTTLRNALVLLDIAPPDVARLPHPFLGGRVSATAGEQRGSFVERVDATLRNLPTSKPDDLERRLVVLRFVLAVTTYPFPHRDSWWARNARTAVEHVQAVSVADDRRVHALPSHADPPRVDSSLKFPAPPWAGSSGLLWTLEPYVDRGGAVERKGRGIYRRQ